MSVELLRYNILGNNCSVHPTVLKVIFLPTAGHKCNTVFVLCHNISGEFVYLSPMIHTVILRTFSYKLHTKSFSLKLRTGSVAIFCNIIFQLSNTQPVNIHYLNTCACIMYIVSMLACTFKGTYYACTCIYTCTCIYRYMCCITEISLMIIMCLYSFPTSPQFVMMMYNVVSEKDLKLRQGLKLIGLKDSIYWMSWYVHDHSYSSSRPRRKLGHSACMACSIAYTYYMYM